MTTATPRTAPHGLTPEQVASSRQKHGSNTLTPPSRPPMWKLYLEKFGEPIVRILLVAAAVSLCIAFVHGNFIETIGIFIAIFLSTGIAFYFERDAARRFDELNALSEEEPVTVLRDGGFAQIARSEVVVGDLVVLEQGMEVPADGDLVESTSLQVNESSLTGEAAPAAKTTNPDRFDPEATYPGNRVLRSTLVADGNGLMQVTEVGDRTEIGKVQHHATVFVQEETPLGRQLSRLASFISRTAFIIAVTVFVGFSAHGLWNELAASAATAQPVDWLRVVNLLLTNFMVAVTLVVMAVPEGLPMAITLSLALNMRRMLKTNNLVRKMHACETMGAINVICTDKTGTLTQNHMQVSSWEREEGTAGAAMAEAAAVNSTAHLGAGGRHLGNPTECALLEHLQQQGTSYLSLREAATVTARLPFSTERKYMGTAILKDENSAKSMLYIKGAPEIVLAHCTLTAGQREKWNAWLKECQRRAQRTLAFACTSVTGNDINIESTVSQGGLQLMGMAAITDPVRPEVPQAVAHCRAAGIRIIVVTGDTAGTAVEIARRIGLWDDATDTAESLITGPEFAALSDEEVLKRTDRLKIISRARPLDKQRLVQTLRAKGTVVAVTGDGTNDAPALHAANVGLSMGSGTSVAKEAGDITLIDDSFRSIATAVMWGRSIYRNIQRFLLFQLTINLVALLIVLLGALLGEELPLTVTQMLWINLIMDTFAAMALASLPPDPRVMNDAPRNPDNFILSPDIRKALLTNGALMLALLFGLLIFLTRLNKEGGLVDTRLITEQTVFFNTFVMLQFWNLLNAKAYGSGGQSAFHGLGQCKGLLWVLLLIFAGQVLIAECCGQVFRTCHLSLTLWAAIVAGTSIMLWLGEAARLLKCKRNS